MTGAGGREGGNAKYAPSFSALAQNSSSVVLHSPTQKAV